ncbi:MAG: hypothetical protein DMF16_08040 [Verrucomicrobia bacterium]|nr:MAG: hypothetical protein DMF16_08040 [Verrucomicrobiota bacterium]
MLRGEALRRRGGKELAPPSASIFGPHSLARVSRVGDRVLAIADFSIKTVSARRRNQHARRMRYPEQ